MVRFYCNQIYDEMYALMQHVSMHSQEMQHAQHASTCSSSLVSSPD